MFYFLSLFWILSITGLLVILFKKKFEMLGCISLILGTLILYLFGFINHISYGFYFTWLIVFLFHAILLKWHIKKEHDKLKEFKDNFLTIGLVFFTLFTIYVFILYRYKGFYYCDEFMHWGPMLKETLRLDSFYSVTASRLIKHKDYPPFFTLLQVLFSGFNNFVYHEPIAYMALIIFMYAMLMPVMSNLHIKNKKDWLKGIIIFLCVILLGLTIDKTDTASDYALLYNSIYTDWDLALFAAYGIYMIYKEKNWEFFKLLILGLVSISFILMKQMGLVYWVIFMIYAFIKVWLVDKKLSVSLFFKGAVCLIVLPVLAYLSWRYIVNLYGIVGQFNISEFNINDFINIIKGQTSIVWKYETFVNYIYNVKNRIIILHPFKMTYIVYVFFIVILIFLIKIKNLHDSLSLSFTFLIGAVGYGVALLILYVLYFASDEAPTLASFDRYLGSYLFFGTALVLIFAMDEFYNSLIKEVILFVTLLLFIEPENYIELKPQDKVYENYNLSVVVVRQWEPRDYIFNREDLNGLRLDITVLDWLAGEEGFNKFKEALKSNNGLYVIGYDDNIYEYWNKLNIDADLYNEYYYVIEKNDDELHVKSSMNSYIYYAVLYYSLGLE